MKLMCKCGIPIFVNLDNDEEAWKKINFYQSFPCDHPDNIKHKFNIWSDSKWIREKLELGIEEKIV